MFKKCVIVSLRQYTDLIGFINGHKFKKVLPIENFD